MIIFENLKLAFAAIRANKMRSFLTMLGMIIGISSVITIVSLGDTMRGLMASEYENVGLGLGYIYIIAEDGYYTERELFTLKEKERIQEAMGDDMLYVGFGSGARGDVKNGRRLETVYIEGLAENPSAYEDLAIIHGRMFTDTNISNKRNYVLIEDKTAISLFGQADVVGKTIKVPINQELQDMVITGVYTNTDSALMRLMSGGNSTSSVYVPEPLLVTEDSWNSTLLFVAGEDVNFADFQSRLISLVSRMKNVNPQNINFMSAQEEMSMLDTVLSSLSLIVGAIAAISLLVGGIGIMNIMLVSVTERTREIGIRKALGAQTSDIMVQFLVESAIISAAGGIIGTLLGLGLVSGGALLVGLSVIVKPYTVLISVAFSAVVGIFFGLYPASKAAKADPVVALRYE